MYASVMGTQQQQRTQFSLAFPLTLAIRHIHPTPLVKPVFVCLRLIILLLDKRKFD